MSTRSKVNVYDGSSTYSIYRHSDGYPEGVVGDIKVYMKNYHDPYGQVHGGDYWLMNFAFYNKLANYLNAGKDKYESKWWEYGYGICNKDCKHGDLEYEYFLDLHEKKLRIMKYEWKKEDWVPAFEGTLERAFEKYGKGDYANGCHLSDDLFDPRVKKEPDVNME